MTGPSGGRESLEGLVAAGESVDLRRQARGAGCPQVEGGSGRLVFPVGGGQKSRRVIGRLRDGGGWDTTTGGGEPKLLGETIVAEQAGPASRLEKAGWAGEEGPSRLATSLSLSIIANCQGFDLPWGGARPPVSSPEEEASRRWRGQVEDGIDLRCSCGREEGRPRLPGRWGRQGGEGFPAGDCTSS